MSTDLTHPWPRQPSSSYTLEPPIPSRLDILLDFYNFEVATGGCARLVTAASRMDIDCAKLSICQAVHAALKLSPASSSTAALRSKTAASIEACFSHIASLPINAQLQRAVIADMVGRPGCAPALGVLQTLQSADSPASCAELLQLMAMEDEQLALIMATAGDLLKSHNSRPNRAAAVVVVKSPREASSESRRVKALEKALDEKAALLEATAGRLAQSNSQLSGDSGACEIVCLLVCSAWIL